MDIVLTVNRNPGGTTHKAGGILDVALHDSAGPEDKKVSVCDPNSRLGVIRILGLPDKAETGVYLRRLKRTLEETVYDHSDLNNPVLVRQHRWEADLTAIPQPAKNDLSKNGVCEVTWAQAKTFLTRRVIADPSDENQDTRESITDADL